jgi:ABC-type branched-subunit amino acid transport system ATPase component
MTEREERTVPTPDGSPDDIVGSPSGPLLEVEHLQVVYPNGARGVQDVSLTVREAEIVAVLGRNGAGKTSILRGIAGFLRSEHATIAGRVALSGHDIGGSTPMRTFRRGVMLVPERDKVFSALTVADHLAEPSMSWASRSAGCGRTSGPGSGSGARSRPPRSSMTSG